MNECKFPSNVLFATIELRTPLRDKPYLLFITTFFSIVALVPVPIPKKQFVILFSSIVTKLPNIPVLQFSTMFPIILPSEQDMPDPDEQSFTEFPSTTPL